ncbi:MAG: hypothetical protein MI810_06075 [Flavobacteriales bacterium]|nr:hypothetical protein [Flavobacteriales bacterium]
MSENVLDSIYIDMVVVAVNMGDRFWMHGKLEIFINSEKPHNEEDVIDVDLFLESLEKEGEYFIFSCCCGIPSCSGWEKGIEVKHQGDTIQWTDLNTGRKWVVDRNKMISDMENVKQETLAFKKFFRDKNIDYVGLGYNW